MLNAILERVNAIAEQVQLLRTEVIEFRRESDRNFRQLQRQFDHLAGQISRRQIVQGDLEERVGKLEEKPHKSLRQSVTCLTEITSSNAASPRNASSVIGWSI